jgi:CheY-like chemotaxis protein
MGSPPLGALTGVYALVVDDNDDARDILRLVLSYGGALVVTATSAGDALGKLRQVKPSIVVCDVQLGDADAIWLLGEAKKSHIDIPFIAVSGFDYDDRAMRAAGFVTFLPKPVNHEALVRAVLSAVDRTESAMPALDENDARLITRAITDGPVCVPCIVARTGVPRARAERILATLGETLNVSRDVMVCEGCTLTREAFKLT